MAERGTRPDSEGKVHRLAPADRVRRAGGGGADRVASWRDLTPADHLPTLTEPFSLITEQYRMLRVQLDTARNGNGKPLRVVGLTSALPGEGKTCTALNLAIAAAQELDRQVAFIECDLRRQRVRQLFKDAPAPGVTEVLSGSARLAEALFRPDRPDNLNMLHAGSSPVNPVELLGSEAMGTLMERLRQRFDLVFVDTPPALNFADASRVGPRLDAFLLVVRAGKTPRDALAKTHRLLQPFGVAGAVLNGLAPEPGSGYGSYYKRYYRRDED